MSDDPAPEFASVVRFGRYEIPSDPETGERRELGKGGMGVTYKARDTRLGRLVVLKVVSRALQGNPTAKKRFLREAKALALLKHPGVPVIYDFGEESGDDFYAMELIEGEDLEARVKRAGELPVAEALNLAEQAARALGAAHRAGLIHRDIKPANLMLTRSEHGAPMVKLIDFGLAKGVAGIVDFGVSTTGDTAGHTPLYASPEQCRKEPATQKSDLYSLGATLWCLLTGKGPFRGSSVWEVENKHMSAPVPVEKLPGGLPLPVRELLERLLAKKPEDRPETADEVAGQLSLLRNMVEVPVPALAPAKPPSVLPPPPKPAQGPAPSADPRKGLLGTDETPRGGGVSLKRLGLPGAVVAVLIGLFGAYAGWFSGTAPPSGPAPIALPNIEPRTTLSAGSLPAASFEQLSLANNLFESKKWLEAAMEYEGFLGANATASERQAAFYRLGECYRALSRLSAAATSYRNLLIEAPDSGGFVAAANYRLGVIYYDEGDYRSSYPLFQHSAKLAKAGDLLLNSLYYTALCLEKLDRGYETRVIYERILEIEGYNPYREHAQVRLALLRRG